MPESRLCILHTESSTGWGGQELRILTEAQGVAARGHELTIAAPAESPIYQAANHFGVNAIALPIARKSLTGVRMLYTLLNSQRYDVINTHSSTDSWLVAFATRGLKQAPAIIRTRHISAPVPQNYASRWLYGTVAQRIVTTGENLRQQLIAAVKVAAERVVSIPTGINLECFQPGDSGLARQKLGIAQDTKIIGIVATMRAWKGHSYLLEALANLDDKNVQLVMVGDGPQRAELGKLADQLGIAARVHFAGNQNNVVPWLQALDIFCLPSWANEGVPQALMQAMACALPVITTTIGSINEIVTDGLTGIIIPPKDSNALRAALERLLAAHELRQALGYNAHQFAIAHFAAEIMITKMLEVFHAVTVR